MRKAMNHKLITPPRTFFKFRLKTRDWSAVWHILGAKSRRRGKYEIKATCHKIKDRYLKKTIYFGRAVKHTAFDPNFN